MKKIAISLVVGLVMALTVYAATVTVDNKTVGTATYSLTTDGTDMTLTVDKVVADTSTVDGYTPVLSASATTKTMIQSGTLLVADISTFTNTFSPVYSAAPVVVCTYASNPGDVAPCYVVSVASNQVVVKAAVTNVAINFVSVGLKP